MKGKTRLLLISAVLILAVCFVGTGASWGADASPPAAGAPSGGQTVAAPADTTAPTAPAETQTAPPATPPSTAATTAPGTGNVPMTEVTVKAEKEKKPKEGSAEVGYKVENVTITGPWGEMKLQDTPYSILVMPSEMIENTVASDPYQLFKMNPLTQSGYLTTLNDLPVVWIRGFEQQNPLRDGIPIYFGYGISLEDTERVEVYSGLSGFLYGAASSFDVGGQVNYVTKRPTEERLNSITVGDYGGSQGFIHGDFGGPIGDGKFGYRINIVEQPEGNTGVEHQTLQRDLFSGAFDYHIMDNLLLQVDIAHRDYLLRGQPAPWYFPKGPYPSAYDANKLYSQKWTDNQMTGDSRGSNLTWDINDTFTFRAAYRHQEDTKEWVYISNTGLTNGTYNQNQYGIAPVFYVNDGYYLYLDSKFATGPVEHKLTAGFSASNYEGRYHIDQSGYKLDTGLTIDNPYVPEPSFPPYGDKAVYTPNTRADQNMTIGDDIRFSDKWSALAGLNNARIDVKSAFYGSTPSSSDRSEVTPTLSLIYKPVPWISTYATYMEALQQGAVVPDTGYANSGQVFSPIMSYQYEVGAKATVGGMLLTTALFRIEKANQITIPTAPLPTINQDGREVHQGIEFTGTGKVTDRLTLWGGFTFFNATVEDASTSVYDGKKPNYVAEQMAKVYAEYRLPGIEGLFLTGGVYYTGTQYADTLNTQKIPAYIIGDVGARYETMIKAYPTIFRLYVNNVTDKSYWSNPAMVGPPLTVAFSTQVKF